MQDARWTNARSGNNHERSHCGGLCVLAVFASLLIAMAVRAEATADASPSDAPASATSARSSASSASSPAVTVVRMLPTAVVTAEQVTLRDIASLTGAEAQLAGAWPITASPEHAQDVTLSVRDVQKALIRRGINPTNWVFRGSTQCRIHRPMPVRSENADESDRGDTDVAATGLRGPAVGGDPLAAPAGPDPETLEGAIHAHFAQRLAEFGGRPSIQVSPKLGKLLGLRRPEYEFRISHRGDRSLGLVPLEIALYHRGKLEQIQSILVQVSLVKSVVVAAGPINRGQTIEAPQLALREQVFDRADHTGLTNVNAAVGQRAVRFVDKGEMLTSKDFEPVPLVNRNDIVTVTARIGTVAITGTARSLGSAGYGETVELRNEMSKQTFTGIVTGPQTAELVAAGVSPESNAVSMAGARN